MTSPIEGKDGVVCLNLKGKELWRKTLGPEGKGQREHRNGSTSNPSPVADKGRLYLLTDRGEIHCLDLKTGKDIWKEKLPRWSKSFYSSPVLAGEFLYCGREAGPC